MQTNRSFASKYPESEEQMMEHNAAAAADDYYYVFCHRQLKQKKK